MAEHVQFVDDCVDLITEIKKIVMDWNISGSVLWCVLAWDFQNVV
jgi:hypothetical protein